MTDTLAHVTHIPPMNIIVYTDICIVDSTRRIESTVSERCHTPILREKEEEAENTIGYKYIYEHVFSARPRIHTHKVEFECITVFFSLLCIYFHIDE